MGPIPVEPTASGCTVNKYLEKYILYYIIIIIYIYIPMIPGRYNKRKNKSQIEHFVRPCHRDYPI
jgi:hypothetical protein